MSVNNTKTVALLFKELREQADIEDLENRHSDAQLMRMLNRCWRRLRTKVTSAGFSYFLEPTADATLPTAPPITGEQYLEVDWPPGCVGVYGVDVKRRGGNWDPLLPGTFSARRDYQRTRANVAGNLGPETFVIRSAPTETGTGTAAGKIMLFPLDTSALTYRIWYLPVWEDVAPAATQFVLYGHDLWFDWLLWEMECLIHIKDDDSANALAGSMQKANEVWADIVKAVREMDSAGPKRIRHRPRQSRRRF